MTVLDVDIRLEGGTATVLPRRRPPTGLGIRAERFVGGDPAAALAITVRRARLLRTLRSVAIRVVLETAEVLLEVVPGGAARLATGHASGPDGAATADGFAPPSRLTLGGGDRVLEVALDRRIATDLGRALAGRRCAGTVRVELGPLVRADRILRSLVATRPDGLVVDVSRAAVTLLEVRAGGIASARAVPAADLRGALHGAAAPLVRSLGRAALRTGRAGAPWLNLSAPDELAAGVRRACAAMLLDGQVVDVVVVRSGSG